MVYNRLLPGTDTPMDLFQSTVVHHLEEHEPSLCIESVFMSRVLFLLVQFLRVFLLLLRVFFQRIKYFIGQN